MVRTQIIKDPKFPVPIDRNNIDLLAKPEKHLLDLRPFWVIGQRLGAKNALQDGIGLFSIQAIILAKLLVSSDRDVFVANKTARSKKYIAVYKCGHQIVTTPQSFSPEEALLVIRGEKVVAHGSQIATDARNVLNKFDQLHPPIVQS